jgi:Flp pilus assembly protein TadG
LVIRARRSGNAGAAAVELALLAPAFVSLLVGVADFSMAYHDQLQLSSALAAGAEYAFTKGQTESGSTLSTDVTNFVTSVSPISLTSVTASYNNGLSASSCYCVHGSTPSYTLSAACGTTCLDGSGSTSGKYISIFASFTYTAIFTADQVFFSGPFTQTVTARLQ